MTVNVVAQIATHDQLEEILAGWPEAMAGDAGAEWLAERLRSAGVAVGPGDGVHRCRGRSALVRVESDGLGLRL